MNAYGFGMTQTDSAANTDSTGGAPGGDDTCVSKAPPRHLDKRNRRLGSVGILFGLIAAAVAGLGVSFGQFAHAVSRTEAPAGATADAIVVLTGGKARISAAIRLLEEGRGERLLISGVHPGTTRQQLAAVTASELPLKETSVELDRVALNTAGNASETAAWVRRHDFKSLLVVTSAYHLPRAANELSDTLPDVTLIGYPVFSADLRLDSWYSEPATIKLLIREYVKYMVAKLRIALRSIG